MSPCAGGKRRRGTGGLRGRNSGRRGGGGEGNRGTILRGPRLSEQQRQSCRTRITRSLFFVCVCKEQRQGRREGGKEVAKEVWRSFALFVCLFVGQINTD